MRCRTTNMKENLKHNNKNGMKNPQGKHEKQKKKTER